MSSLSWVFVVLFWELSTKDGIVSVISTKTLKMRFEADQGKAIISHSLICHSDAHGLRIKKG